METPDQPSRAAFRTTRAVVPAVRVAAMHNTGYSGAERRGIAYMSQSEPGKASRSGMPARRLAIYTGAVIALVMAPSASILGRGADVSDAPAAGVRAALSAMAQDLLAAR